MTKGESRRYKRKRGECQHRQLCQVKQQRAQATRIYYMYSALFSFAHAPEDRENFFRFLVTPGTSYGADLRDTLTNMEVIFVQSCVKTSLYTHLAP